MESMKDFEKELEESYKQLDRDYIEQAEDDGDDIWVSLKERMKTKEIISVKIKEAVKGGVTANIDEQRAFIPASQLSDEYIEKLEDWVGKHVEVIIKEVDKEKKRVILSGRDVIDARKKEEKDKAFAKIKAGDILEGSVESIQSYGAFVNIGEGLSGLLHISQISERRIKSPKDVLKEGQVVKVKVLKTEDGKVSLSMKGLEEEPVQADDETEDISSYTDKEAVTTNLGAMLAGLKLD